MKKIIIILIAIFLSVALAFWGCNIGETLDTNETNNEVTTMSETNNVTNQTEQPLNSEPIVWVEGDNLALMDECGLRTMSIRYREVDLLQPYLFDESWAEAGFSIEPQSDLLKVLGWPIASREEAASVANEILASEGQIIGGLTLELMQVEHDPNQNIWIFSYWENNMEPGSSFHVAMCGESGGLLRMWVL